MQKIIIKTLAFYKYVYYICIPKGYTMKKPYQIRLEEKVLEKVKSTAKKENRSINNMFELLIKKALELFKN